MSNQTVFTDIVSQLKKMDLLTQDNLMHIFRFHGDRLGLYKVLCLLAAMPLSNAQATFDAVLHFKGNYAGLSTAIGTVRCYLSRFKVEPLLDVLLNYEKDFRPFIKTIHILNRFRSLFTQKNVSALANYMQFSAEIYQECVQAVSLTQQKFDAIIQKKREQIFNVFLEGTDAEKGSSSVIFSFFGLHQGKNATIKIPNHPLADEKILTKTVFSYL